LLLKNRSGEVKDREVRNYLVNRGHVIHGVDLSANVLDIGNPEGYQSSIDTLDRFDVRGWI
jgi:hypothetical protein